MSLTPTTLFWRLKGEQNDDDWRRFVEYYRPWILRRLAFFGVTSHSDCDDLSQEVLTVAFQQLPHFEHNGQKGAARKWLGITTMYVAKRFFRDCAARRQEDLAENAQRILADFEDPNSSLSHAQEAEERQAMIRRLIQVVSHDFTPITMQIFEQTALRNRSVDEVAREFEMTPGAVKLAKHRVLARLRAEAHDWLD